jgi:aspartate ammonia-lyase
LTVSSNLTDGKASTSLFSEINTIILDLDGTLYVNNDLAREIRVSASRYIASLRGIDESDASLLIEDAKKRISAARGLESTLTAACIDLGGDMRQLHEHFAAEIKPELFLSRDDGLASLLDSLTNSFDLYIYTNNNRFLCDRIMKSLGISDCFRGTFTIEDYWRPKPDITVLEKILLRIGRTPTECLFIGDRYDVDLRLPASMGSEVFLVSNVWELVSLLRKYYFVTSESEGKRVAVMGIRTEMDTLGPVEVPADAYYGAQTARAIVNFPISGLRPHPTFVWATLVIKNCAARANMATGRLDRETGEAIVAAAEEALDGKFDDNYVVDTFQAGAGTSHNMNVNEVLANRAEELLGGNRGEYARVHPNDHVNMAQSTNDVIPTAMRLASLRMYSQLRPQLERLRDSLHQKGKEFDRVLKSGRTHLQDAVPIRLGQEFEAYAVAIGKNIEAIERCLTGIYELGLGGTAVGTGLNAEPRYIELVVEEIGKMTGFPVFSSPNLVEAMHNMDPFVQLSSVLKGLAINLTRIANDLRILASGPMTGLNEINLPPVQPGSSIMPGKVNPVVAEMVNMVSFQVIGADTAVTMAAQAGQLELNVMMPVIIYNLLFSMEILKNAVYKLSESCIEGITANVNRCTDYLECSVGMVTVLAPFIGYAAAAEVAKESVRTGRCSREIIISRELLSPQALAEIVDPYPLTNPGVPGKRND